MESRTIKATRRSLTGKQVKALRREGRLPAVMYGHNVEPITISMDAHDASLMLAGLSSSTILTIDLEGEEHAVLVREKQRDYIKNRLVHVDFQVVSLTEKIRASVSIDVHGTAPAVSNFDAVVVTNVTSVMVEALPRDLPERLIVDISGLENIGDAIHVRDLKVSDKVAILADLDEVVVVMTSAAPEVTEEEGEGISEGEMAEPEVIERGKREEDEE
jgi:large subunit ribosomal protein L25